MKNDISKLAGSIDIRPAGQELWALFIERGKPVNPTKAQSDTGIRDIKAVADTLVYLDVISHWVRNEEATLFAGCRLLNNYITGV